ncbi:MAG: O-antigen ligase family protein [Verrucomicrobia bacterium]|nr:O-antigen ligase family protein [Verrucomicrobiota bacterium]
MTEPAPTSNPRATVWEWALTAVLAANLAWTTLCLGGVRPDTWLVTSALNGLLFLIFFLSRAAVPGARLHPAGWLLAPFLAYAAVNAAWVTPVPWLGWWDWLGWAQMLGVFWVVLNGVRARATRATLLGVLVTLAVTAVALACYQRFVQPDWLMLGRVQAVQFGGRSSGSFGLPNSLAGLLILLLPVTGALAWRRGAGAVQRVGWGYLMLVLLLGLGLTISRGGWLALAAVLVAWPLLALRGPAWRKALWAVGTALAIGAALVVLWYAAPGVRARLAAFRAESGERTRPEMWRGAGRIWGDHPLLGSGAGSYNTVFEKYRSAHYQDEPGTAHNEYLHTLSDYGAAGFVLFFGACALIVWRSRRGPAAGGPDDWLDGPALTGGLTAGLAAVALHSLVEFHFKIPALALIIGVLAALLVQRRWPASTAKVDRRDRIGYALAGLAVVLLAFWAGPLIRGETERFHAREKIDELSLKNLPVERWSGVLLPARAGLRRAVTLAPGNGAAWCDLAYATALSGHIELTRIPELGRGAEVAAARALGCSEAVPEFWVRHAVGLDMQGRWAEAETSFGEALKRGPNRVGTWYNYAFHLSIGGRHPDEAWRAVETCLRLDPGNREAQALRQQLASRNRAP